MDVIKLRLLRCGDDPGFSRWAQCNLENLHKGGKGVIEGDVTTEGQSDAGP